MKIIIVLISLLPLFGLAQTDQAALTKGYTLAIGDFLKATIKEDNIKIDTLFLGQYEDLKDQNIPKKIENVPIYILKGEKEGRDKLSYRSSFYYANLISWPKGKQHQFLFVSFLAENVNGKIDWWPLHDCTIDYDYNVQKKEFRLIEAKFKYPYNNKYTKK